MVKSNWKIRFIGRRSTFTQSQDVSLFHNFSLK